MRGRRFPASDECGDVIMGLGLPQSGGGGDRTPIIKYDGRAGRIFRVDREQRNGQWETNTVEITNGFQAVMDLEQIEIGWLSFPAGGAPDIKTVPLGQPFPDRPSDKHKAGFRVLMKLGKDCGGDVREMASNANVSIAGMDALHDAYSEAVGANQGKLPIVTLEKTTARVSSGQGQTSINYEPVWKILKWIDRPAELPLKGQGGSQASPAPAPANEGQAQPVTQARTTSQEAPAPDDDQF